MGTCRQRTGLTAVGSSGGQGGLCRQSRQRSHRCSLRLRLAQDEVTLALREASNVRSLRVATNLGHDDLSKVLGASGLGTLVADNAWLGVAALGRLAAVAADQAPAAADGFAAMLEFAGSHGWLNPGGTHVQAHVSNA
jgi:hypothetical protein